MDMIIIIYIVAIFGFLFLRMLGALKLTGQVIALIVVTMASMGIIYFSVLYGKEIAIILGIVILIYFIWRIVKYINVNLKKIKEKEPNPVLQYLPTVKEEMESPEKEMVTQFRNFIEFKNEVIPIETAITYLEEKKEARKNLFFRKDKDLEVELSQQKVKLFEKQQKLTALMYVCDKENYTKIKKMKEIDFPIEETPNMFTLFFAKCRSYRLETGNTYFVFIPDSYLIVYHAEKNEVKLNQYKDINVNIRFPKSVHLRIPSFIYL